MRVKRGGGVRGEGGVIRERGTKTNALDRFIDGEGESIKTWKKRGGKILKRRL